MDEPQTKIDTRGYRCPLPLAMVSRRFKSLAVGERARVLSDDRDFKREIQLWCYETGNALVNFTGEKGYSVSIIEKGAGFRAQSITERIRFIFTGVRLHAMRFLLRIIPVKRIAYLVGFVSVGEGMRADAWLRQQRIGGYVSLPVPEEITRHCGLVLGFSKQDDAVRTFNLLREHSYAVEDIYHHAKDDEFVRMEIDVIEKSS